MFDQLKAICISSSFLFPFRQYADTDSLGLPHVHGKIKWEIKESVPEKSKIQLFSAAQNWLRETYDQEMYSLLANDYVLSGELVTGTPRRPQRRVAYTITCEDHNYILEIENVATYIGGAKQLLGNDKAWVYMQYGFDYYIKRLAAGKDVKAYERVYRPLRLHIYDRIIEPLKKWMQKNI